MKKIIFVGAGSFVVGALLASLVFLQGEAWVHGRESTMVLTRPLLLAPTGSVSGLENCTAPPQVTLASGTRVSVRKHGPVHWIEIRASIVGKDIPLELSSDPNLPVLTCGKW